MQLKPISFVLIIFLLFLAKSSCDISGGYEYFVGVDSSLPHTNAKAVEDRALDLTEECRNVNHMEDLTAAVSPIDIPTGRNQYFVRISGDDGGHLDDIHVAFMDQRISGRRSIRVRSRTDVSFDILYQNRPALQFGTYILDQGNVVDGYLAAEITSAAGTQTIELFPRNEPPRPRRNAMYVLFKARDNQHLIKKIRFVWSQPGDTICFDDLIATDTGCAPPESVFDPPTLPPTRPRPSSPTDAPPTRAPTPPPVSSGNIEETMEAPRCFTSDDTNFVFSGEWNVESSLSRFLGVGYHIHQSDNRATAAFNIPILSSNDVDVRLDLYHVTSQQSATNVPVEVIHKDGISYFSMDQRNAGYHTLGAFTMSLERSDVELSTDGVDGDVIVDGIRFCGCIRVDATESNFVEQEGDWENDDGVLSTDEEGKLTLKSPTLKCGGHPCLMEVYFMWEDSSGASDRVEVEARGKSTELKKTVDMTQNGGVWYSLGVMDLSDNARTASGEVVVHANGNGNVSVKSALFCRA